MTTAPGSRLRVLFVNENIGGHRTVHHHLRSCFHNHPRVDATFVDVPSAGLLRRIIGTRIPGLATFDLDLQPLRAQLALSFWVRRALRKRRGHYDVLHVYTQNAALLLKSYTPVVISTDTTNVHNALRRPQRKPTRFTPLTVALTKPIERRALRRSAMVVSNSLWARASLLDDYGLTPDRVTTIPFGIPASATNLPASSAHDDPPTIGFVGRQFKAKGGEDLLSAFSRLGTTARLLLVTPEPIDKHERVDVVADLTQGDGRLWDLLGRCSIFAFPSPIDQAPNAVLEAMAAGLPVVAVNTGAVGEMVAHGETGLLIEAGDQEALYDALRTLVDDSELRARMGAAGRRRFEERYDMSVAVEALADVFEQVSPSVLREVPT